MLQLQGWVIPPLSPANAVAGTLTCPGHVQLVAGMNVKAMLLAALLKAWV